MYMTLLSFACSCRQRDINRGRVEAVPEGYRHEGPWNRTGGSGTVGTHECADIETDS